jgi:hypothetical protein
MQLGFKAIEAWSLGEYYPNRSDDGNIPLKIPMAAGKISIKEFTDRSNAKGVSLGLHTLQNFLQRQYQQRCKPCAQRQFMLPAEKNFSERSFCIRY